MPSRKSILLSLLLTATLLCASAARAWQAHSLPRTLIFTQAQLKYPLNPHYTGFEYFTHWIDWPLFIDDSLKEDGVRHHIIQYPDCQRIQYLMGQYGLDGLAMWEELHRVGWRADILGFTNRNAQKNFHIFPLISSDTIIDKDIRRFLESPHTMRLDGKLLVLDPNEATGDTPEGRKFRQEFRDKLGDKHLLVINKQIPWDVRENFYKNNRTICDADRQKLSAIIRGFLKTHDGFGWGDLCTMARLQQGRNSFNGDFYRALMRMTAEVFAEEPYRNKLFMAEAVVGHENPSSVGHILSSDGTKTLRESLMAALDNGVDLISVPEWDEENENTCLRPTVCNGTSHLRIMRYITSRLKGTKLEPLPGDNPQIPNLILSARKIISLGERLDIELLNVPDTDTPAPFTAQLNLRSLDGKLLHAFPTCSFNGKSMQEFRPEVPSEKFADQRVILPELVITDAHGTRTLNQGFAAIQLQSTWNFDYKWIKQPLRGLMDAPQVHVTMAPAPEQGVKKLTAKVNAAEELSFAEVLDNGDCIYSASADKDKTWRETDEFLVFRLGVQSVIAQQFSGSVALRGTTPEWKDNKTPEITYRNAWADQWHRGDWVRMPRKDLDKAFFDIDLPGIHTGKIPVRDLMTKQSVIVGGYKGLNLSLTRQLRQYSHPRNLRTKQVDFSLNLNPDLPCSVIQLQLIAKSGRIWRHAPLLSAAPAQKKLPVTVYSETKGKPVTVKVPANLVPQLNYDWNSDRGLIVPTTSGRTLWGVRGGFLDFSSLRNSGGDASIYGVPCSWYQAPSFWKNEKNLAAPLVKLPDGTTALSFNGHGEHVSFPKGTIPRRAGFTIVFQINPKDTQKKQFILSNRHYYSGALNHLFIENGKLHGSYVNHDLQTFNFDVDIPLKANAWNDVIIRYDLRNFVITINGQTTKKLKAIGPGLYDIPVLVGSWETQHFEGMIRNFRISHVCHKLK